MTMRDRALENLMALGFALDDALLYLDTHPQDAAALEYYQAQQAAYQAARQTYMACYGPLQQSEVPADGTFMWVETPWPWEGEE